MSVVRDLGGPRSAVGSKPAVPERRSPLQELDERSREIFRRIVEEYVETGEPVGSRTLSRRLAQNLSPATIRNVMADLQEAGLLYAPHTSAGRLPTDAGLRVFVNGLLEFGDLTPEERAAIDARCAAMGRSFGEVLETASTTLAGLARCAGLVLAPKNEGALKHIEFVPIGGNRALVVLVGVSGLVENRVIELPSEVPATTLAQATNYLNARLQGSGLAEARERIRAELVAGRAELDGLTGKVVEAGLATWSGEGKDGYLIVRGQAKLLDDVTAIADLERIRQLFEVLETRESMVKLLETAQVAEGVQIFIGAETALFGLSGCSVVITPFKDKQQRIVGALGVVGPTRLNYARVIPMVDYTARAVAKIVG